MSSDACKLREEVASIEGRQRGYQLVGIWL
jgi:hypothetical protein